MSDGDAHRRQRDVIGRPLTPRRSPSCAPTSRRSPTHLVDRLVERRLVRRRRRPGRGHPVDVGARSARLARRRAATTCSTGRRPTSTRSARSTTAPTRRAPADPRDGGYAQQVARAATLPDGAWPRGILAAAERGDIDRAPVPDAAHRLPRAVARHHDQRDRQRRLAVRHPSRPVGRCCARDPTRVKGRSTRCSASRARSAASPAVATDRDRVGRRRAAGGFAACW